MKHTPYDPGTHVLHSLALQSTLCPARLQVSDVLQNRCMYGGREAANTPECIGKALSSKDSTLVLASSGWALIGSFRNRFPLLVPMSGPDE